MADIREINGQYFDFSNTGPGFNQSFLQTAMELKELGIKNYYFMLRIDNPRIADIDPYKRNITGQEVAALMQEMRSNIWFYTRVVARIRSDAGIVRYGLHRGLAAMMWCFERSYDNCLTEPRQTWKTSGTLAGPLAWAFQLSQNLKMHFFGKESENTKRNLGTLRDDVELLPEWLRFTRYFDSDGKVKKTPRSTEILKNKQLNNEVVIHAEARSLSRAQGMGRGASAAIIYFDEIEHTPFFDEILSNSAPAFKTAHDNAAAAGLPTCRLMSSTPGNLDTREGRTSYPIIKSMIPWSEKIYDMTPQQIEEYKNAFRDEYNNNAENNLAREVVEIFYIEYQYWQLRKDYNWVMEQYALSGDRTAIRREILLQRLRGSTDSPFAPEDIEYLISNMVKSTNDLLICNKWRFRLYEHGNKHTVGGQATDFDPRIPYIIGMDPSGAGADNTSVTIVNPYNLKVAAEFKSPYISTTDSIRMLIELVSQHIPKAVIYPERNSMGIAIIQMLAESSIRENLYWSDNDKQVDAMAEESPEEYQMRVAADEWKKYGVYTTKKVRDMMFQILLRHVNECKELLNTEYLVDDMCKLVRTSTGKIEAGKGEHDDSVMSYNIAMYLFYTGDNLELFGINNKVHPVLGAIEENGPDEIDTMKGFFSIENVSFEDLVMRDAARVEQETKYLVDTLSFVHDDVYSNQKNRRGNSFNDDVDIDPYFFDIVNGGGF